MHPCTAAFIQSPTTLSDGCVFLYANACVGRDLHGTGINGSLPTALGSLVSAYGRLTTLCVHAHSSRTAAAPPHRSSAHKQQLVPSAADRALPTGCSAPRQRQLAAAGCSKGPYHPKRTSGFSACSHLVSHTRLSQSDHSRSPSIPFPPLSSPLASPHSNVQSTSVASTSGLCDIFPTPSAAFPDPHAQCIAVASAFASFYWGGAPLAQFPGAHVNPSYCTWSGVFCTGGATGGVYMLCAAAPDAPRPSACLLDSGASPLRRAAFEITRGACSAFCCFRRLFVFRSLSL